MGLSLGRGSPLPVGPPPHFPQYHSGPASSRNGHMCLCHSTTRAGSWYGRSKGSLCPHPQLLANRTLSQSRPIHRDGPGPCAGNGSSDGCSLSCKDGAIVWQSFGKLAAGCLTILEMAVDDHRCPHSLFHCEVGKAQNDVLINIAPHKVFRLLKYSSDCRPLTCLNFERPLSRGLSSPWNHKDAHHCIPPQLKWFGGEVQWDLRFYDPKLFGRRWQGESSEYAQELRRQLSRCYKMAWVNMKRAAERQGKTHNTCISQHCYTPGQAVMKRSHKHSKLQVPWVGPYMVRRALSDCMSSLIDTKLLSSTTTF